MINGHSAKRRFAVDPNEPPIIVQKKNGDADKLNGVSITRLKDGLAKDKSDRLDRTKSKKPSVKGKGVNWADIDLLGDPIISFDPTSKSRIALLKVLSRGPNDHLRRKVVAKLEREFSRIYTRYRRQADRNLTGRSGYIPAYELHGLASKTAILCLQKGVRPTQLLRYWHIHIRDFTDLKIPTLAFLSSPANVDRVACAEVEDTSEKPKFGSSFSAIDGLSVRVRPALERAGYDTRMYNDRFLLSIQHTAIALARGKDIFVANGRMKEMSTFLAKELFCEK